MKQLQMVQITPEELKELILDGVKEELKSFKKHFQPKEPAEYMTRVDVAELLKINLSTVHNWTKKGTITSYQIGGRVYYKRQEIVDSIIELKK